MNSMTLEDLIRNWVERAGAFGTDLPAVLDEMVAETRPGGRLDPDHPTELGLAWNSLALGFMRAGAPNLTIATYNRGIQALLIRQREYNRRYHKGMFLHNLALGHAAARQDDAAFWFHRLAFVEDALSRDVADTKRPETAATGMLRLYHGVSDATLDAWLKNVGHSASLEKGGDGERIKARNPEVAVTDAALNGELGPGHAGAQTDIPVNSSLLEDLDRTLDSADTNVSGINLERLTAYLCLTLPGARIANRVHTRIGELDIVVVLRDAASSYFVETLGRTLLVECKNWDNSVGVQQINHLAARVRLHGCRAGLLVAKNGVSGSRIPGRELMYGQLLIQGWFHQDGVIIGVIDREGIRALGQAHPTFGDLVLDRYDALRFAYASADSSDSS